MRSRCGKTSCLDFWLSAQNTMSCGSAFPPPGNLLHGRYEILVGPPEHSTKDSLIVRATDHGVMRDCHDIFLEYSNGDSQLQSEQYVACMRKVYAQMLVPFPEHKHISTCEGTDGISVKDFASHCTAVFGRTRQVVLKCMSSEALYEKERHARSTYHLGLPTTVPLLSSFVYIPIQGAESDASFPTTRGERIQNFPYVLVMPAMGRSWREISHTEDLSAEEVRGMLHSLALALRDLHDKGVVHGGLCLRHVLRAPEVGTAPAEAPALSSLAAVLIDFTSVSMHNGHSSKNSNVASTDVVLGGNSAYLPPEMLCASETGILSDSCMSASAGSDIWALGAIMYTLCTGRTLFHCDRYENLCDAADSHRLLAWLADSAPLHNDIRAKLLVRDPDAADLLCGMLQPCAERRLGNMEEVLRHPYFESIVATLPTPPLNNRTVPVDVGESVDLAEHGETNGIECVQPEESAPQIQSDALQQMDASGAISASGDAGVVQALLAAMQQGAEASQSAAFLSQSINVCESRVIGQEGGFLRGVQGISVEIPPLAMAPGGGKEVSLEVLEGAGKYAALPSVSPIVRITPCNYQFRRPVYVTLPHCLLHATKANLSVALFDSVYGLRNVLDPNAVQYLPQSIRFPVSFACDVVATFRDPSLTRHLSSDCSNALHCRFGDCDVPISGLRPRRQCRYCDTAFCVTHCTRLLNGAYCCDACDEDSWTVYMQARCEASGVNSDVELSVAPCYKPARSENVLRCSYRENMLRCSVQVNLNEREFTQSTLGAMSINFKVPAVAVVMVSDVRIKDQEPCQWRFYKT